MKPIRIACSADPFDQWRLSEVDGKISAHRGKEMFVFDTKLQRQRYLELNNRRSKVNETAG